MAGRPRQYDSPAAKQAAYRERREQAQRAASAGYSDKELGQAARDLHISLKAYVAAGRADLASCVGETPLQTLKYVAERMMPWQLDLEYICNL